MMQDRLLSESPTKMQEDYILAEDLIKIADSDIPLVQLENKTFFITGATGMIGSQIVKALLTCNIRRNANIRVLAFARSEEKASKVFEAFADDPMLRFIYGDIQDLPDIQDDIDFIIHGASVTASKDFVEQPVETIRTAVDGSIKLLEMARFKKVKSFIYLSSLEVYGVTDNTKWLIDEGDYGYIEPLNVRSSYSESKRLVECLCASYTKQHGVPVKIARLCQTFGAGVEYNDNRVFAQFARCVIEKKDIVLHTKGETVRNYCYTSDAIRALFFILVGGENGTAYNVANMSTAISIKDMAGMLVDQNPKAGIKVVYEISEEQKYGYNPTVIIRLNTERLQSLGWNAEVGLKDMYQRMIQSMLIHKQIKDE